MSAYGVNALHSITVLDVVLPLLHVSPRELISQHLKPQRLRFVHVPFTLIPLPCKAALELAKNMRRVPVTVPEFVSPSAVATNFFSTKTGETGDEPILFLHGFDSSLLEFRRVLPELEQRGTEAYAVDVLGWGFTEKKGVSSFGAGEQNAKMLPGQS